MKAKHSFDADIQGSISSSRSTDYELPLNHSLRTLPGYSNSTPRVLAILLLGLIIALALTSKAFGFDQDCGRIVQAWPNGMTY